MATTQRSRPDFSSSSMSARCSLRDRAVVRLGEQPVEPRVEPDAAWTAAGAGCPRGARARPATASAGCSSAPAPRAVPGDGLLRVDPLLVDLVQPGGQPLREPPGVREHDGRAVLQDEVDDRLLDVRPDRPVALRRGSSGSKRPAPRSPRCGPSSAFGQLLPRRGRPCRRPARRRGGRRSSAPRAATIVDGGAAAEEARDLLDRPHRGREADALRGPLEQRVEPLERQRQVRAALGRRDGVHLVDDHRVDVVRVSPGRGGEHQVERLGRRDQDVGRVAGQRAPLAWRGVARPHADRDRRRRLAEPLRGLRRCRRAGCAGCARRRRRAP